MWPEPTARARSAPSSKASCAKPAIKTDSTPLPICKTSASASAWTAAPFRRGNFPRSLERALADERLTYFEALTSAAFQIFAARRVDIVILETGLGEARRDQCHRGPFGLGDHSIGLDHTQWLGTTLPAIAGRRPVSLSLGVRSTSAPAPRRSEMSFLLFPSFVAAVVIPSPKFSVPFP